MSAVAGWYSDPSGAAGQLRWWDGERWTEHVTADPSAATEEAASSEPVAAATVDDEPADGAELPTDTGTGDAGAGSGSAPPPPAAEDLLAPATAGAPAWGSGAATGDSQPPPPGAPGSAPVWETARPSWGGAANAPSWEPVPRPSGDGVRTGLIVAAVAAVVLVGLVGVVFLGFVRTAGDFSVAVGPDEGFRGLDGEVISAGSLDPGGRIRADVPDGGSLELEIPVDAAGSVTIDVRGADGFDAVAELVDEFDAVVAYDDDRSTGGRDGAGHLDPLLDVHLEPGIYRVHVRGFGGDAGTVDVARS